MLKQTQRLAALARHLTCQGAAWVIPTLPWDGGVWASALRGSALFFISAHGFQVGSFAHCQDLHAISAAWAPKTVGMLCSFLGGCTCQLHSTSFNFSVDPVGLEAATGFQGSTQTEAGTARTPEFLHAGLEHVN